jgi:hypothetical protein
LSTNLASYPAERKRNVAASKISTSSRCTNPFQELLLLLLPLPLMMMIHRDRFEACILEKMSYLLTDQIRYTDIYLKLANWRRWAICPTDQNRIQNTQQEQTILHP